MILYLAKLFILIFCGLVSVQPKCKPGDPENLFCYVSKHDPEGSEFAPVACACHDCEEEPFYGCANAATKGVVAAGQRDGCRVGICFKCKPVGVSCTKGDVCCDGYKGTVSPYIYPPYDTAFGYCSAQGKCALCAADKHICRYYTSKKLPCCSSLTNHSSPSQQCLLSRNDRFSYCVADACATASDPNAPRLYGFNCPPISKNFYFCACGEVNKKGKVVKDFKQCKGSSCEKCIPPGHSCTPGKPERECCAREEEQLRGVTIECRNGKCQECFEPHFRPRFYENYNCNETKIPCCLDTEEPEDYTYKCTQDPKSKTFTCALE